jgi:hypothetical protein
MVNPMLRIYVAEDCHGSRVAVRLADMLRAQHPEVRLEVVDIGNADAVVPAHIFGTPMYTWHAQVIFMGNPSEAELLERIRTLHEQEH